MLQPAATDGSVRLPYLRAANVQPDGELVLDDLSSMWFKPAEVVHLTLQEDDVVVVEGGQGGFGRAAHVAADVTGVGFQNSINRIRPSDGADGRFITYYLLALRESGYIRAFSNVVSMPHLTAEKLAALPAPVPPRSEQRAIADYLDRETAQIDTLIEEQQRLLVLAAERETAVRDEMLDRLDWSVPLRSISDFIQTGPFGSQLKSSDYVADGVPVINPSHISGGRIEPSEGVAVDSAKAALLSRHRLAEKDLIVARRGELGRAAVVDGRSVGFICGTGSALIRPRQDRVETNFLGLVFQARRLREALLLSSVGSTMHNLNADILGALRVPVPPLGVQQEFLSAIDDRLARYQALDGAGRRMIELSSERRAALITAAVTGQIEIEAAA